MYKAGQQYQKINAQTGVVDADPHRLIQMLYTGALEQMAVAKGCIQRDDLAGKGVAISKAIGIVGGLSDSVKPNSGSEVLTNNLTDLYEFVTQRLTYANIKNDSASLDEAISVIKELQAGWNGIRSEVMESADPATV